MLFRNLHASAALSLEGYTDIDHFHESERYAQAESIPLRPKDFSVLRASLALPSGALSLVRTFPRLIHGYDLSGRLVIVVPMDDVASTRINGKAVGQSLIVLKGSPNCTVLEPEGRLIAILSIQPEALDQKWLDFSSGYLLLRLPAQALACLQTLIRITLEGAATQACAIMAADVPDRLEETLFAAFDESMCLGTIHDSPGPASLARYKTIIDRVDDLLGLNPIDASNEKLAEAIGVSLRTLQTATQSLCGSGIHRYTRLKRLWSARRQLRSGAAGLTVKASALAHGFWHMSEFSNAYRLAFGELPSSTLARARFGTGAPRLIANGH
jgi:AraC family transcriptional regulator, ethanolamine operon transcriptional activator